MSSVQQHALDEARVLCIYTGGTIGMLLGPSGYRPEPYFLTESLQSQARFNDPSGASFFSHASSSQGFQQWNSQPNSNAGSADPSRSPSPRSERQTFVSSDVLRVRSSRPIGVVKSGLSASDGRGPSCRKLEDDAYEADLPALVTPLSTVHGGPSKRIRYAILEWDPLLDSSNIESEDWIRIASEIELNYDAFDAFVVMHGTDTMAYTASALSFLLEDLGKTVIVTGAQIPLSQLRNDAVDNLLGALVIAGHYIIPESCLFFNHVLLRGNRSSKTSSYDFDAFTSPNFPPLVNVGIDNVVNWDDVIRQTSLKRFRAHKELCPNVATLRLFPGIPATAVRAFLAPPTQGVVLETFGAGNAPQRADLLGALKEACDRGVVIVAISQCAKGTVSDAYEAGRMLLDTGVVAGGDMTPECALAKLSYLLSKPGLATANVRELIGAPIRGELTRRVDSVTAPADINRNVNNIQTLLAEVVRLSSDGLALASRNANAVASDHAADDAAAWSSTASEAAATEAALYPFLIHSAAARNDASGIEFCVQAATAAAASSTPSGGRTIPGGIINCVDPTSGRSPLHTAALNGSTEATATLLKAGALVHLRDTLGHTALYYAARKRHAQVVDLLRAAGANLSGADLDGGFVALAVKKAKDARDDFELGIWAKCGAHV